MRSVALGLTIPLLVILLLLAGAQVSNSRSDPLPAPVEGALRVVTLNTHYIAFAAEDADPWSVSGWQRRRGAMAQVLQNLDADIIAFQEMETFVRGDDGTRNIARDDLLQALPELSSAATGDWRSFPSTQPIFFRRDRLEVTDQGWFFFSETPDVIYSRTYDGSYPAFASWAQFRDRQTGKRLRVVNVHTDFRSGQNRLRSAELIAERLRPWIAAGEHVLLAGDLNAMAGSKTVRILRDVGLSLTPVRGATYHFNRGFNFFGAIDHVLHDCGSVLTDRPVAVRDKPGGQWPSDHYPVLAQIRVGEGACSTR